MTAPGLVYLFCFITCAICAGLLVRSWMSTRARLLAWSAAAFVFFAINNFFVFADMVLAPDINLIGFRHAAALAGITTLIIGFIWEAE